MSERNKPHQASQSLGVVPLNEAQIIGSPLDSSGAAEPGWPRRQCSIHGRRGLFSVICKIQSRRQDEILFDAVASKVVGRAVCRGLVV